MSLVPLSPRPEWVATSVMDTQFIHNHDNLGVEAAGGNLPGNLHALSGFGLANAAEGQAHGPVVIAALAAETAASTSFLQPRGMRAQTSPV